MENPPRFTPEIPVRPSSMAIEFHLRVMDAVYQKRIREAEQPSEPASKPSEEKKS